MSAPAEAPEVEIALRSDVDEVEAPRFDADIGQRACELLTPSMVAAVVDVEPAEIRLSEVNRDHGVVDACTYGWREDDLVRHHATLRDIEVRPTVAETRIAFEQYVTEHGRGQVRRIQRLGDEAYWSSLRLQRHSKVPDAERHVYANTVMVRVANLWFSLQFRNGAFDEQFEAPTTALAHRVVQALVSSRGAWRRDRR